MKLKWKQENLTLVIIPEANRSVVRFRIANVYACLAAAGGFMLLAAALLVYALYLHANQHAGALKSQQLHSERQQLNATLAAKNQAIDQLQNEVIRLSRQTEQMKAEVARIQQLERDLLTLAPAATSSGGLAASKADISAFGTGGLYNPVSQAEILELGERTAASLAALQADANRLRSSLTGAQRRLRLSRAVPSLWPTASQLVTSDFGYRKDPFTAQPSFHSGIDIGAKADEPVFAAAYGKVVSTGSDRFRGNNIVLEHGGGLRTCYMHLNKIFVNPEDTVEEGAVIGLVGSTGRSTGPHLHYEVTKNGKSTNPRPYLKTIRKDAP